MNRVCDVQREGGQAVVFVASFNAWPVCVLTIKLIPPVLFVLVYVNISKLSLNHW